MCTIMNIWSSIKETFYKFLPSCISPLGDFKPAKTMKEELIFFAAESGYFHIQATKPDTIGTYVAI